MTALFAGAAKAERTPAAAHAGDTPETSTDDGAVLAAVEITAAPVRADNVDRPQSKVAIGPEELAQQGISRLQDALGNVPGLTLNAGEGGAHGDSINLRGLSLPNSFFLDGLRDSGQYQRDTFNLERVDVLLGPSSVRFGWGSTAGVVDSISKQAGLAPFATAELALGTAGRVRATGDFDLPIAENAAARLSFMDEHSGIAGRDLVHNQRSGIAPTLALGIGTDNRFTLSLLHQEQDDRPDYGLPFIDGAPARVDTSNYYGLANYDRTRTGTTISTVRYEHDIDDDLLVTTTLRSANDDFLYLLSAPHLDDDASGVPPPGTPLADIRIYRDQPSSSGAQNQVIGRTELRARFAAQGLDHELAAGLELARDTTSINRLENGIDAIAPTPLLTPDPYFTPPTPLNVVGSTRARSTDAAVYVTDSVTVDPQWELDAGLRADRVAATVRNDGGSSGFTRSDQRLSPRAAIVFRPAPGQLYSLSYGASFNPAIDYLSLAPTNSSLPPETDRSIELGATWPLVHQRLKLSTALFDEQLRNARLADPGDPAVQLAAYDQAVRGVEIALAGQLASHWNITAAYTHLDARLTAAADPLARDRTVPNTPRDAFNLWSAVAPGASWTFAAGVRFAGQRFADFDNTARVPATLVANLMGACRAGRHLSFQLNVDNVANRHTFTSLYYAGADENHAVPGPGRTLIFTARLAF